MPSLISILHSYRNNFTGIVPFDLKTAPLLIFDLTRHNPVLTEELLYDTKAFTDYLFNQMNAKGTQVAIGRYNEDRVIYQRSKNYSGPEHRSIHLGIDLWCQAGTPVYSPLPGILHSYRDNAGFGDYGPTIILEHRLENTSFFTLYGHLSKESLLDLVPDQHFQAGELIGTIGTYPENGDWPPHLHFQIINAMLGKRGDFPGVAAPSERDYYLQVCPDPNIILQIPSLPLLT